ncbi:SpaA isopeptide-forming pilin-related protein, partial [Streptomyces sp. NPDC006879]|uniref:SpaA isopeptide-forming pilin-related protein n=1 Tax=Streptomyces sp. NPDC006879 TaxID=3364767 RepID=UPI003685ED2E
MRRLSALGVVLPMLTSGIAMAAAPAAARAEAGDGTVKVRVVREVNANGTWDRVLEPGMQDVEVTLTDDGGRTITGRTGADGTVTFDPSGTPLVGGKYRVQVINPKPNVLYSAFASHEGMLSGSPDTLTSTEEFVVVSGGNDVELTTAFWNPVDYCQKNADLVTACIRKDHAGGPADNDTRTLVSFPYNARGNWTQRSNGVTDLSDKATTGALYGIAYSKQQKWIFSGAMARRGSAYGPAGQGGIYLTDKATGETTLFTTVPNAGTTAHNMTSEMDVGFSPTVTKEALGDVDVSEDGKDLYVVNLNDKKLYRYDATQKTASEPKASYTIPDPDCSSSDDWRPFGLGVQDGVVYVGGVCSAESTQKKEDLRAVVQTFDPEAGEFTAIVMDERLDFAREVTDTLATCNKGAGWYPWADGWRDTQDGKTCSKASGIRYGYPQPVLADIVVETNGDLVLGFRDRWTDQSGHQVTAVPGETRLVRAMPGGDINRACKGSTGGFLMDANGGCKNNSSVAGIKEYYAGDARTVWHPEAAFAGIALSKVEENIATSIVDPSGETYKSGTGFINRFTGAADGGKTLTDTFGKGGSMADLEVMCDEAPIQIGNRVWYDVDKDGIQDPGEKPVNGATVNLYDAAGKRVATTKTTARGEYYFDNSNVPGGLKFRTEYTIKIDNPADYEQGGPLYQWVVTQNDAGDNDFIDSDGKVPAGGKFPEHTITTGDAGQDNHTYDFGYHQPALGAVEVVKVDAKTQEPLQGAEFQLWRESNGTDGLQLDGEKPDTKVGGPCVTDGKGVCRTGDLELGVYYWQETKAPVDKDGKEYALPDPAVFGPLELTEENSEAGATVTAPNRRPDIDIEKKDEETNSDADTEEEKVVLPDTREKILNMDVTNNGSERLYKIEVGDLVTKGDAKVKDLTCEWPDGTKSTDPEGKRVIWEASWPENPEDPKSKPEQYFEVGGSYKCTATLYDLKVGELHTDQSTVNGEGEFSHKSVKDDDPWNGEPEGGAVEVVKVDSETGKPLEGAAFQLWRESNGTDGLQLDGEKPDTKVGEAGVTDGEGRLKVGSLDMGVYYWQETKAPNGYPLLDPAVFGPLELTKDNAKDGVSITAENTPP